MGKLILRETSRALLILTLWMVVWPSNVAGQHPFPTSFAARVTADPAAAVTLRLRASCNARRAGIVATDTAIGAVAGWLVFTIGVGALTDSHGSAYRRERWRWIGIGAAVGVGRGVIRAVQTPCS